MKREIKFRGLSYNISLQKNVFRYGYLLQNKKGYTIRVKIDNGWYGYDKIIESSIGQFTGLTDKNGNEIYEGDICKRERHKGYYEIVFRKSAFAIKNETESAIWYQEFCNGAETRFLEVIGNIYENPELIK